MEFLHELVDIDKDGRISFRVRGGAAAGAVGRGGWEGGLGETTKGGMWGIALAEGALLPLCHCPKPVLLLMPLPLF